MTNMNKNWELISRKEVVLKWTFEAKLKEYKLKLEGGLETLDLLDKREENGSDTSQHSD